MGFINVMSRGIRYVRNVMLFFLVVNLFLFGCGKPEGSLQGNAGGGSPSSGSAPAGISPEAAMGKTSGAKNIAGDETVLTVGDTTVSYMEFLDQMRQTRISPSDNREAVLRSIVDRVIHENYLFRSLKKRGFSGAPLLGYEKKYRVDDWLAYRYQQVALPGKIMVSEEALKKSLPPEFIRLKASEIAVANEEEARNALARVRRGEPFDKVAREVSLSPSSAKGGAIDYDFIWGSDELYGGGIEDILFRANPGEIVGPVPSPWGYNLFRVESKKPLLEEERKGIIHTKRNAIYSGNYTKFIAALKAKHPLSVKTEELRKAASDPADSLDRVVAEVGKNRIPFGQVYMYQRLGTGPGSDANVPRTVEGWSRLLSGMHLDLAFREEAVADGMLEDALVKDNLRRLDKALLVRYFKEKKGKETGIKESQIRENYEKIRKAYPKQKSMVLDLYRFDLSEIAVAARHALEKGKGIDYLEKTFELERSKFFTPSVRVYEGTLAADFKEPVEMARPGDLVGPVEVFEAGEARYYLVKVQKKGEERRPEYGELRGNIKSEIIRMQVDREIARLVQKESEGSPLEWRKREEMEKGIRIELEKKASRKISGQTGGGPVGH